MVRSGLGSVTRDYLAALVLFRRWRTMHRPPFGEDSLVWAFCRLPIKSNSMVAVDEHLQHSPETLPCRAHGHGHCPSRLGFSQWQVAKSSLHDQRLAPLPSLALACRDWNKANKRPERRHLMVVHNVRSSEVANHERRFQIYRST